MERFKIGDFDFAADSGELINRNAVARLEPKPTLVLRQLCLSAGRVVSRQCLLDACWGQGDGSDEALTQCIAQIRRALEKVGQSADWIQTRSKAGYRLAEPRSTTPSAAIAPRRRPVLIGAIAAAFALLALWIAYPHAARHFIRHNLGQYHPS